MPLPSPSDSLKKQLDSAIIEEANKEVSNITSADGKRSPYLKVISHQKATIAKYAAEHGIVNSIRHFKKDFLEEALKESTIRGWKKTYLLELQSRKRAGEDLSIKELPTKKIGQPLMLGKDLDEQVQAYLKELGRIGGVVIAAVAMASAKGKKDSRMLAENGGHVVFTKDWAHYLLL